MKAQIPARDVATLLEKLLIGFEFHLRKCESDEFLFLSRCGDNRELQQAPFCKWQCIQAPGCLPCNIAGRGKSPSSTVCTNQSEDNRASNVAFRGSAKEGLRLGEKFHVERGMR